MLTFVNDANRCWFISALQVLLHIPQIANVMREDSVFPKMLFTKRKNASDFASAIAELAKQYWKSFEHETVADVSPIIETFTKINRNFAGKKMYDASECFLKIIETLETAFIPKPPSPLPETCNMDAWNAYAAKISSTFLADIFLGQALQKSKDGSTSFDHFTGLTISGNHSSVDKGIAEYLHDPDTGVQREITKFPLILPVFFQKTADKNFVTYDISLSVEDAKYDLFAVLLHVGNCHWIALAKGPTSSWKLFDDSNMKNIIDINTIIQRDAMLLLYKKIK
jgi:ubiquitin C-terminal hydrolase